MILSTCVDIKSDKFKKNYQTNIGLRTIYHHRLESIVNHDDHLQREKSRNKLTARQRINQLKDQDSTILELGIFAGYQLYQDLVIPCGGIITAIVKIKNQLCMVFANDQRVKAGTYFPITIKKHLRAQLVALANRLPCIYLVDSGGANLNMAAQVFADREHFGRIFYHQAQLSAENITQIASVHGYCTAGGAYIPAMCEISIIVKNQGKIFLAGPPLVYSATKEQVSPQQLGGHELHSELSGLVDYVALSDDHALELIRSLLPVTSGVFLDYSNKKTDHVDYAQVFCDQISGDHIAPPLYDINDLLGIISHDNSVWWNPRELIARIVDGSRFIPFKDRYGKNLVCGYGNFCNITAGILANQGVLDTKCAQKATHFIELCDRNHIPLIFIQNISGFIIGVEAESSGIAKEGAKMVHAVSCASVGKITLIVGGSHGAGNYAMCGRAFEGDFLFVWPNAKTSIMSADNALNVLNSVKSKKTDLSSKALDQKQFIKDFDHYSDAYYCSSRLWDDGIIDPLDTRKILSKALAVCKLKKASLNNRAVIRN